MHFGLESAGGGGGGLGGGGLGGGGAGEDEGTELFVHEDTQVDSLGFGGACRWVLRDIGAADRHRTPELSAGDRGTWRTSVQRRQTQPPRFLQEHELIERMDAHRIGTDASMAVHVSNIVDRGFVVVCTRRAYRYAPRPPRAGAKPRTRQVGRYMVPTPLGIQLIALFGGDGGLNAALNAADASGGERCVSSPALLSQPAIRARMEAEVKQIARGELSQDETVGRNVEWFHERYRELEASLTRRRVDNFARALEPIGPALKRWRRAGAFKDAPEPTRVASSGGQQRSQRGRRSPAAGTSGQRRSYSTRAVRGRGRGGGRGRGRGARS